LPRPASSPTPSSPSASTRGDLPLTLNEGHAGKLLDHIAPERAEGNVETKAEPKAEKSARFDPFHTDEPVERARRSVVAGAGGLIADLEAGPAWPAWGERKGGGARWGRAQPIAMHLNYPTDPGFDDVTAFVPALLPDGADRWREQLKAGGGDDAVAIDDAARALLAAARRALPTGVYRWAGVELAVDAARRIGWRRTTDAGLAETASFDGTTWTRRYAELGLDITRVVRDDDVALELGYLSLLVYRQGAEVSVLSDRCSHLGGPLHQGRVVAERGAVCVTCPWHGSTFVISDGAVVHGPATARQPSFETRVTAAGNKPKRIEEFIGLVNSGTAVTSVARMTSPGGWVEPGQTPEFDEFTPESRDALLGSDWKVSPQSNRMGFRLDGPRSASTPTENSTSSTTPAGACSRLSNCRRHPPASCMKCG
jgi:nitrite reductase/ring-hydroxylating ferredoxin subunit